MKKIVVLFILGFICASAQAAQFLDDFNRAQTSFETNSAPSIGSGYMLTQVSGDRFASIRILASQLQLQQITPAGSTLNAGNIVFRQMGVELKNSEAGDSFTVSGDLKTYNGVAGSLSYGLAFNYQPDGSFYAARLDTGTDVTVLQFIRVNAAGAVGGFANIANSAPLAINSIYNLTIQSSAVGVFTYTLTGANLDGGQLTGTATETTMNLANGQAGFYASAANTNPLYDNLSIKVLPDVQPGVLRLIGISTVAP
ncbi:MAG: hypothetical protein U9P12_04910 [Verrucomicrobiota bacterium]|nr:hypothetical protein [Verrucomicrobiota bacterium]